MKTNALPILIAAGLGIAAMAGSTTVARAQAADEPAPAADSAPPQTIDAAPAAPTTATPAESDEEPVFDSKDEDERRSRRGIGIALDVSTLGAGLEAVYNLNPYFNARAQINGLSLDKKVNSSGNDYEGKLKFLTYGLLADWHPFAGHTRISAGALIDKNKIDLSGDCNGGCKAGDYTITTESGDTGRLAGDLKFNTFAPYLGFGWGNAMMGSRFHMAFDIGALYQGKPKVGLQATGTATVDKNDGSPAVHENVSNDPEVQSEVQDQQQTTEDDIKKYKFYPVISLAIGYRFGG